MRIPALILTCLVFIFSSSVFAQQSSQQSLAFKKKAFGWQFYPLYIPDYSYQFEESFYLTQKANKGEPLAQQELAIRFLTGEGFPADTARAIYWMQKAADQDLPSARYNLGIFYLNGWGLTWNPFTAYNCIKNAAMHGMADAQYLIGVFSTEDLIVPRNYDTAMVWIEQAAANSFKPAIETKKKLEKIIERKKELQAKTKQEQFYQSQNTQQSVTGADMDFMNELAKTNKTVSDTEKFRSLLQGCPTDLKIALGFTGSDTLLQGPIDSLMKTIELAADCGSPEANVFFGRCYETGVMFKRSETDAALYYLRAFRLESPEAGYYLSKLLEKTEFTAALEKAAAKKEPRAQYVLAILQSDGGQNASYRTRLLTEMKEAANKELIPALLELGEVYFKGKYVERDSALAFQYWTKAEDLGNREAYLRIALAKLFLKKDCRELPTLPELEKFENRGSILALLIQGYLYETGVCNTVNRSKAVECYRKAAFRGNSTAYSSLKRLYNSLRPDSPEFKIAEE